jgi:hypothetical protein
METNKPTRTRNEDLPTQEFNGKKYRKYSGERYYSRGPNRLHKIIWEYYNGEIPKGFDVHHKDENPENNEISNLELIDNIEHCRFHAKRRFEKDPELLRRFVEGGKREAKKWHGSEAGKEWHKKHYELHGQSMYVKKEYECIVCGKKFMSTVTDSKFCSNAHKSQFRRDSGVDNIKKECILCKNKFQTNKYSKQEYCSYSCASKDRIHKRYYGVYLRFDGGSKP